MGDFYHADQVEDETVTSFATRIEGLLSYVRDKFPNQIPLAKRAAPSLKDRPVSWLPEGNKRQCQV